MSRYIHFVGIGFCAVLAIVLFQNCGDVNILQSKAEPSSTTLPPTTTLSVTTTNPPPPPGWTCPTQFPTSTALTSTEIGGGGPTTQIPGVSVNNINGFESLRNVMHFNLNPFPQTGTSGKYLGPDNEVRVFRFVMPNPFPSNTIDGRPIRRRYFEFVSWPNGWGGGTDAYISISSCPGDLRIPTGNQTGTVADPTFAEACRSWRGQSWTFADHGGHAVIDYEVGSPESVSTPSMCYLVPGRTYYLNIIMAKPHYNRRQLLPLQDYCGGWSDDMPKFDCGHGIAALLISF